MQQKVRIIGGGLAGCEAALRLAKKGIPVDLHEMRPKKTTEAHHTDQLGELVCSNSFKSLNPASAPGCLKAEMELLGSHCLQAAKSAAVGAGESLGVDRDIFASNLTKMVEEEKLITLQRDEVSSLPDDPSTLTILATGPLTSESLSESLRKYTGASHFYFYDAISPIIDASSLNFEIIFAANRYDKPSRSLPESSEVAPDTSDYLNCPMNKEEYFRFIEALKQGPRVEPKSFEKVKHFEGCMPIEEMLDRGDNTLRFGPMKPVGLCDPRTGRDPYAVVQLRPENRSKTAYNIVGFQTKLKYGAQGDIFRLIPGLEKAEFLRFGSMHRNTFVDSPRVLNLDLSLKNARHILLAGQITGVEGYMESASIGIVAAIFAEAKLKQRPLPDLPSCTAMGSLLGHLRNLQNPDFQPSGINFGLFEEEYFSKPLEELRKTYTKKIPKDAKREAFTRHALSAMKEYAERLTKL